ncbi:MAG: hypothetical protein HY263_09045, partial [Chloroflexi bacterium]|nr:hypothetical protein [Chloroflexota bacterium]
MAGPKKGLAFVRALEQPPTPPALAALAGEAAAVTEGDPAGYVDAGSLLSFLPGVSLLHK